MFILFIKNGNNIVYICSIEKLIFLFCKLFYEKYLNVFGLEFYVFIFCYGYEGS